MTKEEFLELLTRENEILEELKAKTAGKVTGKDELCAAYIEEHALAAIGDTVTDGSSQVWVREINLFISEEYGVRIVYSGVFFGDSIYDIGYYYLIPQDAPGFKIIKKGELKK